MAEIKIAAVIIIILYILSGCRSIRDDADEQEYDFISCTGCDAPEVEGTEDITVPEAEPGPEKLFVLGRCEYSGFEGKARIIDINFIAEEKIIIINIDFFLYDIEDKNNYRFPGFPDNNYKKSIYLFQDLSIELSEDNIKINGRVLAAGEELECLRLEIVKGACTPVVFMLPEIENIKY